MDYESAAWQRWKETPYPSANESYHVGYVYGTPDEPASSLCVASFLEPIAHKLKEPFCLVDYGCGDGRAADFLSRRFQNFRYYGIEPPGGVGQGVANAMLNWGHDRRMHFGLTDSLVDSEALQNADAILLLSVFTHTSIEECRRLLKKFGPAIQRGAEATFSVFLADDYRLECPGVYHPTCYGRAFYSWGQLQDIAQEIRSAITLEENFMAGGNNLHQICVARKL